MSFPRNGRAAKECHQMEPSYPSDTEDTSETVGKPSDPTKAVDKPPNPTMVLMLSLFGYPGVGHFMVGAKTLGAVIVVVFTGLTLGILYEMWVLAGPLLKLMTEGTPMDVSPNWWRMGFWIVSTGVLWVGASVHAYLLAKKPH